MRATNSLRIRLAEEGKGGDREWKERFWLVASETFEEVVAGEIQIGS